MNNILDKLFKFSGLNNILLSLNLIKFKPDKFWFEQYFAYLIS